MTSKKQLDDRAETLTEASSIPPVVDLVPYRGGYLPSKWRGYILENSCNNIK